MVKVVHGFFIRGGGEGWNQSCARRKRRRDPRLLRFFHGMGTWDSNAMTGSKSFVPYVLGGSAVMHSHSITCWGGDVDQKKVTAA